MTGGRGGIFSQADSQDNSIMNNAGMDQRSADVNHASQSLSESGIQADDKLKQKCSLDSIEDPARSFMQG